MEQIAVEGATVIDSMRRNAGSFKQALQDSHILYTRYKKGFVPDNEAMWCALIDAVEMVYSNSSSVLGNAGDDSNACKRDSNNVQSCLEQEIAQFCAHAASLDSPVEQCLVL